MDESRCVDLNDSEDARAKDEEVGRVKVLYEVEDLRARYELGMLACLV